MEKLDEKLSNCINLRNREIRILIPGHFNIIHAGHMNLIQEVKNSFKKVLLTIGIIDNHESVPLLALHEKLETFKNFPEIDKVCVLQSRPSVEDLASLNIDYIATANLKHFPNSSRVLVFEKKVFVQSNEIFARVLRDYEHHIEKLLESGCKNSALNVSKRLEISILCKKKLRNIKKGLWSGFSAAALEESVDAARKWLQNTFTDWGDYQERVLRSWMVKCKISTSALFKTLKTLWLGPDPN